MDKQISYACTDAWALLRLYQDILGMITRIVEGEEFSFLVIMIFLHISYCYPE